MCSSGMGPHRAGLIVNAQDKAISDLYSGPFIKPLSDREKPRRRLQVKERNDRCNRALTCRAEEGRDAVCNLPGINKDMYTEVNTGPSVVRPRSGSDNPMHLPSTMDDVTHHVAAVWPAEGNSMLLTVHVPCYAGSQVRVVEGSMPDCITTVLRDDEPFLCFGRPRCIGHTPCPARRVARALSMSGCHCGGQPDGRN